MWNEKTVRSGNFTCVHAGPMEGWTQFHMEPPDVPMPARGKLFLKGPGAGDRPMTKKPRERPGRP